jgi:hypothetical protein
MMVIPSDNFPLQNQFSQSLNYQHSIFDEIVFMQLKYGNIVKHGHSEVSDFILEVLIGFLDVKSNY